MSVGWLAVGQGRWLRSWGQQTQLLSCHTSRVAGWSSTAEKLRPQELLLLLLLMSKQSSDAEAKWRLTAVLLAELGMGAAEDDKVSADWAIIFPFPTAAFGVQHDPLHLLAGRLKTVGIAALAGMHQRLHAALDVQAARGFRGARWGCFPLRVVALLTRANA